MGEYRAYIIGKDAHFVRAIELVCPDDETAKEQAKQLVDGHDIELWQRERLVAKPRSHLKPSTSFPFCFASSSASRNSR
jgi:hypothetical protein